MGSNGPSFSWFWSKIVSKLFLTSTYCFFRPLFSFLPFFPFLPFPLAFFCFLSFPRCRRGFLLSVVLKSTISRRKLVKTVTLRCKYTGIVFLTCIRWRRRKVAVAWFHCLFRHRGNSCCCCCCCAWNICWCRALLFDFLYHDDLLFKVAHLLGDRVAHLCGDIVALCDCFWWTLLLLHLCALLPCNVFTHLFVRESWEWKFFDSPLCQLCCTLCGGRHCRPASPLACTLALRHLCKPPLAHPHTFPQVRWCMSPHPPLDRLAYFASASPS